MSEISEYINKNLNANIKQFIFLNMLDKVVDMNGKIIPFMTPDIHLKQLLGNLIPAFFIFPSVADVEVFSVKNRELDMNSFLHSDNIAHVTYSKEDRSNTEEVITDYIHNQVDSKNLILIDVSDESRLNFNQSQSSLQAFKNLDDFFISKEITRVYKLRHNYFIFS